MNKKGSTYDTTLNLNTEDRQAFEQLFGRCQPRTDSSETAKHFGTWVKARRERLGKSVRQITEPSNFSCDWWKKVEAGEIFPTRNQVEQMARPLDVYRLEALAAAGFLTNICPDVQAGEIVAFYLSQLPSDAQEQYRELLRWYAHELGDSMLRRY